MAVMVATGWPAGSCAHRPAAPSTAARTTSRPSATDAVRELHRFPELGTVWHGAGPDRHHPAAAGALRQLTAKGRLDIPDIEVAIIQLYSLLLYPHLVFSTYGTSVDDSLTERLITSGVDMFLSYSTPKSTQPR
ncbi:TetR/AcrR family transcriptional regulator C-terminal domain-containing protein [Streptomyces sp. NPDC051445]